MRLVWVDPTPNVVLYSLLLAMPPIRLRVWEFSYAILPLCFFFGFVVSVVDACLGPRISSSICTSDTCRASYSFFLTCESLKTWLSELATAFKDLAKSLFWLRLDFCLPTFWRAWLISWCFCSCVYFAGAVGTYSWVVPAPMKELLRLGRSLLAATFMPLPRLRLATELDFVFY